MGAGTRRVWRLRKRPSGDIRPGDLELAEEPIPPTGEKEVRVRTLYLSLDPTNRLWMSDVEQYLPPVDIGAAMRGVTLAVVEESRSERFRAGEFVTPYAGEWASHQVLPAASVSRVRVRQGISPSAYMSVLGPPGLTAWVGINEIGAVREGETVTVSAAAGAVGSVAGQLAKARGARVVGIAGGARKCAWLVDELGFDAAIDYKAGNVAAALRAHCPNGIDVHFENVGENILDAAIANMRIGGRIALCGLIATYNEAGPVAGPSEFQRILMQRISIRGFIVMDHFAKAREAYGEIEALVNEGRLAWKEHIVDRLEHAPDALALLFSGGNDGKLMVRVTPN